MINDTIIYLNKIQHSAIWKSKIETVNGECKLSKKMKSNLLYKEAVKYKVTFMNVKLQNKICTHWGNIKGGMNALSWDNYLL